MAPEEWIAAHLPGGGATDKLPSAEAIARANARLRRHIVSSGKQASCDNKQIDRDLAREYGRDLFNES